MGVKAVKLSTQLAPPPAAPKDRAKTEEEKRNTRDWILQYAQEDSNSEDGSRKVVASLLKHKITPAACLHAM